MQFKSTFSWGHFSKNATMLPIRVVKTGTSIKYTGLFLIKSLTLIGQYSVRLFEFMSILHNDIVHLIADQIRICQLHFLI